LVICPKQKKTSVTFFRFDFFQSFYKIFLNNQKNPDYLLMASITNKINYKGKECQCFAYLSVVNTFTASNFGEIPVSSILLATP